MSTEHDLFIKQPVSVWNRELKLQPKDFFFALGKAAISGAFADSKGVARNVLDMVKAIVPTKDPAQIGWALIYKSLLTALSELMDEHLEFFATELDEGKQQQMAAKLETAINKIKTGLTADFFDHPDKQQLLEEIKPPLMRWLMALGMTKQQAEALHLRLKDRFVLCLHQQWLKGEHDYQRLFNALSSPFVTATKEQRSWFQYGAWLQEQTKQRMFDEAFSLSQVYVRLRAYYEEKKEDKEQDSAVIDSRREVDVDRIVVDLHSELEEWVRSANLNPAVRVVCGGPGSGKSSFGKMFAAAIAREMPEVAVLFVPLHHFKLSSDLVAAVEQFVRDDCFLSGSPLDGSVGKERLLIVFDGLDELSMQGGAAAETADTFVDEVVRKIERLNDQRGQRQVLITGRDIAVQSALRRLCSRKQVLHLLPYFVPKSKFDSEGFEAIADCVENYVDSKSLLAEDQRHLWWNNYSNAKGYCYGGIPFDLCLKSLTPITTEPLLNYLVALSYERDKLDFSGGTKLNAIYQDLLDSVYERQYDHGTHNATDLLSLKGFTRVLEEIALAIWHGDGRTATLERIRQQCEKSQLPNHLKAYEDGTEKGISRLLTAFYFRKAEQRHDWDDTFEFTHKSFGEYLIARRIVRAVQLIHDELDCNRKDPNSEFDEREALKLWAELLGPTTMDQYVFKFFCDEMEMRWDDLAPYQDTFASLVGYAVQNGMPMERVAVTTFKEAMRQSRNAEECLMVVHYVCARKNKKVSEINFGDNPVSFGEWIRRLQGQRDSLKKRYLILDCLNAINLVDLKLVGNDFFKANLKRSDLTGSDLTGSDFRGAKLKKAVLARAIIREADLRNANLIEANLIEANLRNTDLTGADLTGADLTDADLKCANIVMTYCVTTELKRADFRDADLGFANLERANLTEANLERANIERANLTGANLTDADLRRADLTDARLEDAITDGANFEGANLTGTCLEHLMDKDD